MSGARILEGADEALRWARGEIKCRVQMPDGVASEMTVHEYQREMQRFCKHEGWSFDKHGRCCPRCNAFVFDPGD